MFLTPVSALHRGSSIRRIPHAGKRQPMENRLAWLARNPPVARRACLIRWTKAVHTPLLPVSTLNWRTIRTRLTLFMWTKGPCIYLLPYSSLSASVNGELSSFLSTQTCITRAVPIQFHSCHTPSDFSIIGVKHGCSSRLNNDQLSLIERIGTIEVYQAFGSAEFDMQLAAIGLLTSCFLNDPALVKLFPSCLRGWFVIFVQRSIGIARLP